MSHRLTVAVLLALAGCARNPGPMTVIAAAAERDAVRDVMDAALRAAAAGRPADSLYLVGATVVADGAAESMLVRFAGVGSGGTATATGTTIEVTPYFAWGVLEYRWLPARGGQPAYGRATYVLERVGGSWRIKHLHSSSLRGGGRD